MVFSRTRICKWTTPVMLLLVLARICSTDPHSHRPQYDHQYRDYYVIRISDPHQVQELQDYHTSDQHHHHHHHHVLGELLGLRFESRVGSLPDYFLYSTFKAPHHHHHQGQDHANRAEAFSEESSSSSHLQKRSLDNRLLDTPGQGAHLGNSLDTLDSIDDASDPVIQRFFSLKARHEQQQQQQQQLLLLLQPLPSQQQPRSKTKRDMSFVFASGDPSIKSTKDDDLLALTRSRLGMQDIQKQRLRKRIKKRAPLPEPMMPVLAHAGVVVPQKAERGDGEEEEDAEAEDSEQEQEEAEIEAELESDQEEQDMEADVDEEDGAESGKDENVDDEQEGGEDEVEEEASENESEPDDPETEYQPVGESQPDDGLAEEFGIEDPGFQYQWHLHNTKGGHDINVTGVWEQGIIGTGVNVAIIDDGLDMTSEDLAPNFNDLCGLGVAYGAKVAGLRILSGLITDVDEAAALNYRFQDNHIYSCSWGPPDDGQSMDAPKGVVLDAMVNGIKNGRGGLGSIYVFATGNGGAQDDDCNFDGYTNSLYTVSIGAIDRLGRHPYYSEACSAQLAVTYSNGGGSAIYTCDVGERRCFGQHGGTSAAAPIAAGMIALVLSVRPDLHWRDVQYLLMTTAIPVSTHDLDWKRTAAGRLFNHKFGYGSMDAYALVEAAKTFTSLGPQTSFHPPAVVVNKAIPQGNKGGVHSVLAVTAENLAGKGVALGTLEHVTVTVNIEHQRRGDVEVVLISPNKVESQIGARRRWDTSTLGFVNWTFMTVKHWDENPAGNWTLVVRDMNNPSYTGKLIDWRIKFWGEVQKPHSNPDEHVLTEQQQQVPYTEQVEETKDREPTTEDIKDPAEEDIPDAKTHENTSTESDGAKVIVDVDSTVDMVLDDHINNHASSSDSDTKASTDSLSEETEEDVESSFGRTFYMFCGVLGISAFALGYVTRHRWMDGRGRYMSLRGRRRRSGGRRRGGGGGGGEREGASSNYAAYNNDNDFEDRGGAHIDLLPRTMSSQQHSEGARLAKDLIPPYQSPSTEYDQFDLGSGSDTDDDEVRPRSQRPQLNVSSPATLPVQEATIYKSSHHQ
ncbi:pheromone processing endoprotease [Podila minutissima]|uniref:Pheromone processing endoprotease n=1 Tax=Podila minutissima TaxID=64525 RepID=A0A9P5SMX2_9FUNG|nr:pheromone processing endoprotease [Podila minutissima]